MWLDGPNRRPVCLRCRRPRLIRPSDADARARVAHAAYVVRQQAQPGMSGPGPAASVTLRHLAGLQRPTQASPRTLRP
jgi:hypothetical protein